MKQSEILKEFKELYTDIDNYNSLRYLLDSGKVEDLNLNFSWSTPRKTSERKEIKELYQKFYDIDIDLQVVPNQVLAFLEPYLEKKYEEATNKLREFLQESLDE